MEEIVGHFNKGYSGLVSVLRRVDDALLLEQNPDEQRRQFFPTIGHAALFLTNNHVMMHLGQVMLGGGVMNLPSAM